jgi:hypothetical protein
MLLTAPQRFAFTLDALLRYAHRQGTCTAKCGVQDTVAIL